MLKKDMEESDKNEIIKKYIDVLSRQKLPAGEKEYNELRLNIDELHWIVFNIKDLIRLFLKSGTADIQILINLYELIVGFGLTNLIEGEEREYSASDFPHTAKNAVICFQYCDHLLHFYKDFNLEVEKHKTHIIIKSLFLCATHSDIYIWSSDNSKNASSEFLNTLLSFSNYDDLPSLLCDESFYPTIFKRILKEMRPWFEKDKWLKNPSSCYIFSWFLHQVKHPYLADYLCEVFSPPHIFMLDSNQKCHNLVAIECFSHILDNVPPSLIKMNNRADVIYSLLKGYVHSSDKEILAALAPCFLKLPDFKYQKLNQISWNHYDEFLHVMLVRADMEYKMQIKLLYLSHIHSFIQVVPPFKHLKRLWNIVEDSLSKDCDLHCLRTSLQILKVIIKSCWPRMPLYCFRILKCLAIFLGDFNEKKDKYKHAEEIHSLCEECLFLLKCSTKEEFEDSFTKFEDEKNVSIKGVEILKSILDKAES